MKKPLFAATIISALVACSVPMTSLAADVTMVKKGNGYAVFVGQGTENLQQTLKDIIENIGNDGIVCPETPESPEQPDIPAEPDSQKPDTQEPSIPVQPDIQEPDTPVQPDTQEPDTQEPDNTTPEEDEVHSYALQVLNLVNAERKKAGLSELRLDVNVTAAANVRAKEIKQNFSHTRPDGSSYSTALTEQGITYKRSGENIAWGQKTPEQVMNAWMNSEGHRANILNKNFQNIGIGYYQDKNGVNHWVQLFTA